MKIKHSTAGFSLPELIVAVSIVLVTVLGFTALMTAVTTTASTAQFQRELTRVLDEQQKAAAAVNWDNMMLTGSGTCILDDGHVSTQAIDATPQTLIVGGVEVTVTRDVRWSESNLPVQCQGGLDSRDEDKTITITATYLADGALRTHTSQVRYSRFAYAPKPPATTTPGESLVFLGDLSTASAWCNDPASSVEVDDTDDVNISFSFTDPAERTCATTATNLTPGVTYTAVAQVEVPLGVTAYIGTGSGYDGTIAVGDGSSQVVSVTFTAFDVSEQVFIGVQEDWDASLRPSVRVLSLRVYG